MRKIEHIINVIHYCIYKFDYKLHMLSNKLNPILLLGKIPIFKKKFEEQGTTHLEIVNMVWTDKRFGFGIIISGSVLSIILLFIMWFLYLILNIQIANPINLIWQPFAICSGLAHFTCYYTVFRNDKYINYFKKFEKWSSSEKWKYCLLSFCVILGSIILFLRSFKFLPNVV